MTAAEIRAKYPKATTATTIHGEIRTRGYCVLGAACRFAGYKKMHFPDVYDSMDALNISFAEAASIADANDEGDFEMAWHYLDEALKGRNPCQ